MAGRILILGAPGAGKGTQALRLAGTHGWAHISTGDIFRAHEEEGTEFGKKIEGYLKAGELVPDALVCESSRRAPAKRGNSYRTPANG